MTRPKYETRVVNRRKVDSPHAVTKALRAEVNALRARIKLLERVVPEAEQATRAREVNLLIETTFTPGARVEKITPSSEWDRIKPGTRGTVSAKFSLPPHDEKSVEMWANGCVWVVWDADYPDPEGAGGDRCFMEPDRLKVI